MSAARPTPPEATKTESTDPDTDESIIEKMEQLRNMLKARAAEQTRRLEEYVAAGNKCGLWVETMKGYGLRGDEIVDRMRDKHLPAIREKRSTAPPGLIPVVYIRVRQTSKGWSALSRVTDTYTAPDKDSRYTPRSVYVTIDHVLIDRTDELDDGTVVFNYDVPE